MKISSEKVNLLATDPYEFSGTSAAELGHHPTQLYRRYYEWRNGEAGPRVGVFAWRLSSSCRHAAPGY
jgi:hypothetical protein